MTTTTIDLSQIQATVLRGYRGIEALPHIEYAFLELGDRAAATRAVAGLAARVTSCAAWDESPPGFVLGLGLTAAGLEQLGQDTRGFPLELRLGMARRAAILGDTGRSSPECWQPGFTAPELHAVAVVSAATLEGMDAGRRFVAGVVAEAPGARVLFTEEGHVFPGLAATEHFGFVDGIGQPYVEGSGLTPYPGGGSPEPDGTWRPLKAGEFVLGALNEAGRNAYPDPPFRNGSYLVYRKLEQRVLAFREYLAAVAAQTGVSVERVAARCMGRWRSGAPLDLASEADDPALASDRSRNDDFRYDGDPHGHKCPHGSHARRSNPRADPTGPTLLQVNQHRLIRRSLPYGPWLPDTARSDDGVSRGIQFAAINADICGQFEYMQLYWVNGTLSSTALSNELDKDPIVGANDGTGKLVAPASPQPAIAWELPRFVDVRGGGYFFLPSLDVLARLGGG
jgi:Dyp-type peroxidase family